MIILPMEIVDQIMHNAAQILQSHPLGASSIALQSHRYRSVAHRETFSTVIFQQQPTALGKGDVHRIQELADLIAGSTRVPTLPGVDTFIASLSIRLSPYQGDYRSSIVTQSLTTIFDHLFREPVLLNTPVRRLVLTSSTWSNGKPLERSIRSMIETSYINSLHLEDSFYVPIGIILGSNVEDFNLNRSIIPDRNDPIKKCHSVSLKSLSITGGSVNKITFEDLTIAICGQNLLAPDTFSYLKKFTICVSSPALAVSVVNSTKVLETLILHDANRLFPSEASEKPAIEFRLLHFLKELNITYHRTIDNKNPQVSPVTFLGEKAPPLLETVTLNITIHSYLRAPFPPPADDLKAAVEERREISEWDRYLFSLAGFCRLKRIRVKLLVIRHVSLGGENWSDRGPSWDEAWCPYFMDAFPMCKEAYGDVLVAYSSSWYLVG
ncbi:hypothetical protein JR316_0011221 [Psilocybe cubensis]|uniref:Uncharacterized protein n=2 Tax=Psilocybe cubensis TaxID=181762 RepID=A0A8H7XWG8_PSICU|nr:hypothetical protein JR316_0011221 [Psilocybe cubensis]KAH9475662.1 hypothetical protein JR316_0011221 [Psilocybe cubensis]